MHSICVLQREWRQPGHLLHTLAGASESVSVFVVHQCRHRCPASRVVKSEVGRHTIEVQPLSHSATLTPQHHQPHPSAEFAGMRASPWTLHSTPGLVLVSNTRDPKLLRLCIACSSSTSIRHHRQTLLAFQTRHCSRPASSAPAFQKCLFLPAVADLPCPLPRIRESLVAWLEPPFPVSNQARLHCSTELRNCVPRLACFPPPLGLTTQDSFFSLSHLLGPLPPLPLRRTI